MGRVEQLIEFKPDNGTQPPGRVLKKANDWLKREAASIEVLSHASSGCNGESILIRYRKRG